MVLTYTPHLRIAIGGSLGNPPQEIWSNSFRYITANGAPTPTQLQAAADALLPVVGAWITSAESLISTAVRLRYVKATWVLATGRQRDANTAQADSTAGIQGVSAYQAIWEQTYVLTFRTRLNRGRAHAGRIYPPVAGHGPALESQAYCAAPEAAGMAHAGAVLLTSMAESLRTTVDTAANYGSFCVVSPGDSTRGTQPAYETINRVECDQVADIMHSRTNRVPRLAPAAVPV